MGIKVIGHDPSQLFLELEVNQPKRLFRQPGPRCRALHCRGWLEEHGHYFHLYFFAGATTKQKYDWLEALTPQLLQSMPRERCSHLYVEHPLKRERRR